MHKDALMDELSRIEHAITEANDDWPNKRRCLLTLKRENQDLTEAQAMLEMIRENQQRRDKKTVNVSSLSCTLRHRQQLRTEKRRRSTMWVAPALHRNRGVPSGCIAGQSQLTVAYLPRVLATLGIWVNHQNGVERKKGRLYLLARKRGLAVQSEPVAILVVEDDQLVQGMVEDALSEGGFEPTIVQSGEEAITLLQGDETATERSSPTST